MQTVENEQGLRKILDMTRLISIVLLILHFHARKNFSDYMQIRPTFCPVRE